jgi:hypothetical protein
MSRLPEGFRVPLFAALLLSGCMSDPLGPDPKPGVPPPPYRDRPDLPEPRQRLTPLIGETIESIAVRPSRA